MPFECWHKSMRGVSDAAVGMLRLMREYACILSLCQSKNNCRSTAVAVAAAVTTQSLRRSSITCIRFEWLHNAISNISWRTIATLSRFIGPNFVLQSKDSGADEPNELDKSKRWALAAAERTAPVNDIKMFQIRNHKKILFLSWLWRLASPYWMLLFVFDDIVQPKWPREIVCIQWNVLLFTQVAQRTKKNRPYGKVHQFATDSAKKRRPKQILHQPLGGYSMNVAVKYQ